MNKLLIASIVVFFYACDNITNNAIFPTEPQDGITEPLAAKGGNPGKPDDGGVIGYCVTMEQGDWTNPSYPVLDSPVGPGKARWPNLLIGWYPRHNNPCDYDPVSFPCYYEWPIDYFEYIDDTTPGTTLRTTVDELIPTLSITTKKGKVTQLALTFRDIDDPNGSWVKYYGNVKGPFPDDNIEELKTPEDGLTIHVHQNMLLKESIPKVKGDQTPDPEIGWISIGDIVLDTPCERWPQ
ncbi:hypothetical protein ACFL46_05880 [Candidatus Neomarinimicrobiota bacterium]